MKKSKRKMLGSEKIIERAVNQERGGIWWGPKGGGQA